MRSILFLLFFVSLATTAQSQEVDPKKLAQKVVESMGGQKAWDQTRILSWNFFGARTLTWDKWTGDVRIDLADKSTVYLININTLKGKIQIKGEEITQPDSVAKYVNQAKNIWINDSYWLIMPYKLQDPGVKMTYLGMEKTEDQQDAYKIQLTFESVGVTPQNKYWIYISPQSGLVIQWSYFANFQDEKPRFTLPWADYKTYGKIKLSGERGPRDLTNIQVLSKVDPAVFTSFSKPSFLN